VQVQNPATVTPLTQVTKIAAGGGHSLALAGLEGNKPVYAWGYNRNGQLGQQSNPGFGNLSTSTNCLSAVEVTKADGTILSNITDIAAGGSHSLFLDSGGNVWVCGSNFYGQLGVGDDTDRNRGVVQVVALTGIFSQVAAGSAHSLALRPSDGTVWAWGYNLFGQLGNGAALGSATPVNTPFQVKKSDGTFLTGVTKIVAIGNHSLAVDNNGQLWAWGENSYGELGLGDSTNRNLATQVPRFSSGADIYHP
jgi:alpha-tubulin suppressor-like RCC1 family protein